MRKVLVLMGDGINSENELARAFTDHGAEVKKAHVNELLNHTNLLEQYDLLAIPGGFSFGDELRSGKILAEKVKDTLHESLSRFIKRDGRIIGICNGFQVLAQLGAFNWEGERNFTLAENNHGTFMDKWTTLTISQDAGVKSPWFRNLAGTLYLPCRHKEGRIVLTNSHRAPYSPLTYDQDVNGSHERMAAVVSENGQIFGLMPHPEVATRSFLYPFKKGVEENVAKVQTLFKNGLQ